MEQHTAGKACVSSQPRSHRKPWVFPDDTDRIEPRLVRPAARGHNAPMPLLLYRAIFFDLVRRVCLTTIVLVTVIAFGAAIKPLAKDSLLSAGQAVKYILLATVPMLQFALPFAAGFAGTMTMNRMATDNEILAAAAGGISYRKLLTPVAALGLALVLIMIILTQWIIPRFWDLLEHTVSQDITRVFQASIERGEPFHLGDLQIWADEIFVETDPEGVDVDTRLVLSHVAAADLDDEGRVVTDVTAKQVVADIYRRPNATYIKLVMHDTVVSQAESGTLSRTPRLEPRARVIPSVLRDDARKMTHNELLRLRHEVDGYGPVIHRMRPLAEALRDVEAWRSIDEQLVRVGVIEVQSRQSPQRRYAVRAERLQQGRISNSDGSPIEITRFDSGRPSLIIRSHSAKVVRHPATSLSGPTIDILIQECEVIDPEFPDTPNARREAPLENLGFGDENGDDGSLPPSAELLRAAETLDPVMYPEVAERERKLRNELKSLDHEITARLLKRYTLSVTALLLLVLGATMAMRLRESMPLVISLMAFLPAVVDMILISSGEHMMRDGHIVSGILVMWSGNGLILLIQLAAYTSLARH
jgi:lipopolysaccharide export LptBFGC system permease protein LptF